MARALLFVSAALLVAAAAAQSAPASELMDASVCYQSGLKLAYDKEFRKNACTAAATACGKAWTAKEVPQSARQTYSPAFRKVGNKIGKADCSLVTANTCFQASGIAAADKGNRVVCGYGAALGNCKTVDTEFATQRWTLCNAKAKAWLKLALSTEEAAALPPAEATKLDWVVPAGKTAGPAPLPEAKPAPAKAKATTATKPEKEVKEKTTRFENSPVEDGVAPRIARKFGLPTNADLKKAAAEEKKAATAKAANTTTVAAASASKKADKAPKAPEAEKKPEAPKKPEEPKQPEAEKKPESPKAPETSAKKAEAPKKHEGSHKAEKKPEAPKTPEPAEKKPEAPLPATPAKNN